MNDKEFYDERQLQIRGNIYKRGFILLLIALVVNGFLNSYGIVWAISFHQNFIIALAIVTVVGIEFHLRNVFFGKNSQALMVLVILGFVSIINIIFPIKHFLDGGSIAEESMLTDEGFSLVIVGLLFLNFIVGLIQYIRNRKQDKSEKEK